MKIMGRAGFSLMELLVSMILLAAMSAMAFTSFSSGTKITQDKRNTALNIARGHLESFYEYVLAGQWATANLPLSLNNPQPQPAAQTLDGTSFTTAYTVNEASTIAQDLDGDSNEDYRRVRMTMTWSA